MTSIIHTYLYEHFKFEEGKIMLKRGESCVREPFTYIFFIDTLDRIIDELTLVFGMTKKELKYYVKGWVRKHNRGFDFEKYWNPPKFSFKSLLFPIIRRMPYRTISMDLASVEPMEGPRGLIATWDHGIQQPEPVAIFESYTNRVVNPQFYGQVNITLNTVVEGNTLYTDIQAQERRDRLRQKLIDLWEPILHQNVPHL